MTSVCFVSKAPHTTLNLEVEYPDGETPAFVEELRALGWRNEDDHGFAGMPPLDGMITTLDRAGTALFAGWSDVEAEQFEAEARAVLAAHGFDAIEHYQLTAVDLR